MPAYLLAQGIDKAKVFRWAFEKFMLMDEYVLEGRKLSDKVLKEDGGGGGNAGALSSSAAYSPPTLPLEALQANLTDLGVGGTVNPTVEKACQTLLEGYTSAKWTYVVAYCRAGDAFFRRTLFEDAQGLLEKELAKLKSAVTELSMAGAPSGAQSQLTPEKAKVLRMNLINFTNLTDTFLKNLMSVSGGGHCWGNSLATPSCFSYYPTYPPLSHTHHTHTHTTHSRPSTMGTMTLKGPPVGGLGEGG